MPLDFFDHWGMAMIQSLWSGAAHLFFPAASFLGEAGFLVALVLACWWCVDRRLGEGLMLSLYASISLNGFLKDLFRRPRPFLNPDFAAHRYLALEGPVDTVHLAESWSFPSGHSQCAAAAASALWLRYRRWWVGLLGLGAALLVMASRVYLGVHYPTDTLMGALLGVLVSWAVWLLARRGASTLQVMAGAVLLASMALLWSPSPDSIRAAGLGAGALAGLAFEGRFVGFQVRGPWWKRALRLVLGAVFLMGPRLLLRGLLPEGDVFLWLRYALLGLAAAGLWPAAFTKLKL